MSDNLTTFQEKENGTYFALPQANKNRNYILTYNIISVNT